MLPWYRIMCSFYMFLFIKTTHDEIINIVMMSNIIWDGWVFFSSLMLGWFWLGEDVRNWSFSLIEEAQAHGVPKPLAPR